MNKPYSESCNQNRDPILDVLKHQLGVSKSVLEIGSGTGQHAVYFAKNLPHLVWHTSDCRPYLSGIQMWIEEANLDNVRIPIELDVNQPTWPDHDIDAIFTANSVHIMNAEEVVSLFAGAGENLNVGGLFIVYGPFNYNRCYTSESNARFDNWLKSRDPLSGIKDFEEIDQLAQKAAMQLLDDIEMPANNRLLIWRRIVSSN